jgi:hypothetical protein
VSEILSLAKARKARARVAAKAQAAENRIRFGLGKAEKARVKAETDRASRRLDDLKRDP